MSYILLVDPNELARRAMKGILARGSHRFVAVETALEAWDFIRLNVRVDLVFVELDLQGEGGLGFIQRLKGDCFLKQLPVVVYTEKSDRDTVKRILDLHVQNFLIKPYSDEAIFAEIAKTAANPWRNLHFEEEKSFCKMMGYEPAVLHKMLEELRTMLDQARVPLQKCIEMQATRLASEQLAEIKAKAEEAGAWGVVEALDRLDQMAGSNSWSELEQNLDSLDLAGKLIFRHLNPSLVPDGFLSSQELNAEAETQQRAVWSNAMAENRCPVVTVSQLLREVEGLAGCPVIDSAAASFQMTANGQPSSLNPLMDLVDKDPGLAAQLLIAINHLKKQGEGDSTAVEDPRLAVGLLGEMRLTALGRSLVTAEERFMSVPPLFSWPHFWMFQMGTARMAQYTCRYLEFPSMAAPAYTAGLLHDLGKLLLLRMHPFAFQAILAFARQRNVPLREAELLFLGTTTHELAAHFAEKHGLPKRFANVMRWIHTPELATEDAELVAIVSLARDLCRQNNVGFCGDMPRAKARPLEETEEWKILRESVFPSFNLRKFELQVQTDCRELKHELRGRLPAG